ncbi:hypothetical protein [Streptomyces cinereoruber]
MAEPLAPQEWQKNRPFSTFTRMLGRRSPWTGQHTCSSPQRPVFSSMP